MRTETIEIYTFDELTEEAKQKVLEKQYDINVDDNFWYKCVYEDAKECAKILGIEIENIYFSGFWNQGDGACFEGYYSYNKGALKAIKDYAPQDTELHRIARELQDLQSKVFYSLTARVKHSGHYYHERCTRIDVSDKWSDYGSNFDDELSELLRDFMQWIYRQLNSQYDYLTTKEAITETIHANEYEFTEDGKMV